MSNIAASRRLRAHAEESPGLFLFEKTCCLTSPSPLRSLRPFRLPAPDPQHTADAQLLGDTAGPSGTSSGRRAAGRPGHPPKGRRLGESLGRMGLSLRALGASRAPRSLRALSLGV